MAFNLGSAIINVLANTSGITQSLASMQTQVTGSMNDIGRVTSRIGSTLTRDLTLPIVGLGAVAVKTFADFESSMNKVSTIADTNVKSIKDLSSGVKKLSDETGIAATETAEALYQAISATNDTANALDLVEVAQKAAIGGFTDATTAVDGLTSTLNAYGMSASEAEKIADQMLNTQNLGKTTFGELAQVIGRLAPITSQLGIETDELFGSFVTMTKQGIQTAEAATGLKAALSNIIKPSKEAADASEAMGIEFNVSALQSKGLVGFLKDLRMQLSDIAPEYIKQQDLVAGLTTQLQQMESSGVKKNNKEYQALKKQLKGASSELEILEGASQSQISAFATMFGSVEGLNAVLALTSETGMKDFENATNSMAGAAGATQKAYDTMQEGTAASFKKMGNELKNLAIDFGAIIAPALQGLLNLLKPIVGWIKNLSDSQKGWVVGIGAVLAAIGPLLMIIGQLIIFISNLGPALTTLGITFSGVALGPIALVVGAIVGLIIIIKQLWEHNEGFRTAVIEMWNQIQLFISVVIEKLAQIFGWLRQRWQEDAGGIRTFLTSVFSNMWEVIGSIFKGAIDIISNTFKFWTALLRGDTEKVKESLIGILKAMWDIIVALFKGSLTLILANFGISLETAKAKAHAFADGVKAAFTKAYTWIVEKVNAIKDAVRNMFSGIKLPSFGMNWNTASVLGQEIKYPAGFNIAWHKNGGLFDKPTLAGIGESGREAVVPLSGLASKAIASELRNLIGTESSKLPPVSITINSNQNPKLIAQEVMAVMNREVYKRRVARG